MERFYLLQCIQEGQVPLGLVATHHRSLRCTDSEHAYDRVQLAGVRYSIEEGAAAWLDDCRWSGVAPCRCAEAGHLLLKCLPCRQMRISGVVLLIVMRENRRRIADCEGGEQSWTGCLPKGVLVR